MQICREFYIRYRHLLLSAEETHCRTVPVLTAGMQAAVRHDGSAFIRTRLRIIFIPPRKKYDPFSGYLMSG